jgi:hypothetical protein
VAGEQIKKAGSLSTAIRENVRFSPVVILKRYLFLISALIIISLILIFVPSRNSVSQSGYGATGQVTPAPTPGSQGVTVGGYNCGPGVRQVPWSQYAPLCMPAWHGNNGGNTALGVTSTTITVTYRQATTAELALLYAVIPKDVIGTNQEAVETMQNYVNLFNKTFELYGRHVVLVPYTGQGDFISEDQGQGLSQAEADAINVAHKIKAFADLSLVDATQIYDQDLANQGVIGFSLYEDTDSYYNSTAPYLYTPGPSCSQENEAFAAIAARTIVGLPAEIVGDPNLKGAPGKLGIIYQDQLTQSQQCETDLVNQLAKVGIEGVRAFGFAFNVASLIQSETEIIAGLKDSGITAVLCSYCDPVSPKYAFQTADSDNYHPEWLDISLFSNGFTGADAFGRIYPQDQMQNVIGIGIPTGAEPQQQEAYQALKLANGLNNMLPSYPFAYSTLMELFSALQAAGPDLTPQTFEAGFQNATGDLPATSAGQFGVWKYQKGSFDPAASFEILRWDPSAISNFDHQKGAFVACNNGDQYLYSSAYNQIPKGQLSCPST